MNVLSLDQYRALVAALPDPTREQMVAFAKYLASAHSWYKALPSRLTAAPLHVFLDPAAGMELVRRPDGSMESRIRAERGFHYSWLPTREHRERFGHWAFSRSGGTAVALVSPDGTSRVGADDDAPMVFDPSTWTRSAIPRDVTQAGAAVISAIIHPHAAGCVKVWHEIAMDDGFELPEESGGREATRAARARCRQLLEHPDTIEIGDRDDPRREGDLMSIQSDLPLHVLLRDERRRQHGELVRAMERVLALVRSSGG